MMNGIKETEYLGPTGMKFANVICLNIGKKACDLLDFYVKQAIKLKSRKIVFLVCYLELIN